MKSAIVKNSIIAGAVVVALVSCSSNSPQAPELFTEQELMAFEETGRAPVVETGEFVLAKNSPSTTTSVADEMKIDEASQPVLPKGDDPVAVIIAADEERKKITQDPSEPSPREMVTQDEPQVVPPVDVVTTPEAIKDEETAVHHPIEVAVTAVPVPEETDELPLDKSYWKPIPEEVYAEEVGQGGVRIAVVRQDQSQEHFKISRGNHVTLEKWFVLNEPRRLVLDFSDQLSQGFSTKHVLPTDSKYVEKVRVGAYNGKSRVVLDLSAHDVEPKIVSDPKAEEVEITFDS